MARPIRKYFTGKEIIERRLKTIKQQLGDTGRLPVPTLEIIGKEQREAHWQSLLAYFLNGHSPHGFGTDVLAAFLDAVESHPETTFESGFHAPDQVDIQTEVPTGNGPVDLLLSCNDEWFICLELKVGSPETGDQMVRYATAMSLGDIVVNEYAGIGEYLYLAPESAPAPYSEEMLPPVALMTW